MNDERRERYAAAIVTAYLTTPEDAGVGSAMADAAMAVANREQQEVANRAARHYVESTARLRAELEEVKSQYESFKKGSTLGGREMRRRLTETEATIARVRSVLDDMEANGRTSWTLDIRAALEGEQ